MSNPVIQTDLADILNEIRQDLKSIDNRLGKLEVNQAEIKGEIKSVDEKLSGQIKSVDEKLSGQIKSVDERLSGQIEVLTERISGEKEITEKLTVQLDKRISNQEFFTRIIGGSLVVSILGGIAGFFWMASKLQ